MRLDATKNRDLLLKTARQLEATGCTLTLNELARRAGVGVATVYRHFENLQALMAALMHAELLEFDGMLERAAAERDPAVGLRVLFLGVLALHVEHPFVAKLVESDDPVVKAHVAKLAEASNAIVNRARKAKAIRAGVTAEDVCHLLLGVHAAALRAPDPAAAARKYANVVLRGLQTADHP